jgi:hypothetical protein
MITKLILRGQSIFQLLICILGAMVGLALVLISLQTYQDLDSVLNNSESDLLKPEYLVLNKKVGLINTDDPRKSQFSPSDMAEIEALGGIERVTGFVSNQFKLKASFNDPSSGMVMNTDLFFEAVEDEFIDIAAEDWKWVPEDSIVPIIVPRDYISLYNFGFAPSQGGPKISPAMIKMVRFDLRIGNFREEIVLKGRIAGFSDRINSVLVPLEFLNEYNAKFSDGGPENPSRIIAVAADASDPELFQFFETKGYVTNEEQLKSSKLNSVMRAIIGFLSVVGGLIVVLSLLTFVMYGQIIIQRAKYEVRVLIELGYNYLGLCRKYLTFFFVIFVLIIGLTAIFILQSRGYAVEYFADAGFEVPKEIHTNTFLAGGGFMLLYLLVSGMNIFRQIRSIAKPGK